MKNEHVVVQGNDLWCKACGQREPLMLPLSVKDFSHHCQTWAQAHADCALVERSKLVAELREVANTLMDERKALREAINALPCVPHRNGCLEFDTVPCRCGTDTYNAALWEVRRLAGLEDKP